MKINVGLVGYGMAGAGFHAPLIQATDGLALTAVTSSSPERVRQDLPGAKVYPTIDDLLADPAIHLVVIATPNTTHDEFARKALLAGKHVVVEKPFVIHSAQANALADLARQQGLVLSVFQNRRWDNDFLTVRRLLATGMLGELYSYEAHFDRYRPAVRDKWKEQDLEGSGTLYDLGSHLIDQALLLFGLPRSVWADLTPQRPGAQTVDYFHLLLDYGQLRVLLHSGSVVRQPGPRFQLHGTAGSFIKYGIDPQERMMKAGHRPGDPGWGEDQPEQYGDLTADLNGLTMQGKIVTLPGWYHQYYDGVYRAIAEGGPNPVSPEEARNTIRVIEHAIRSHEERRTVVFEP